jgi:heat shock protein HslJ
MKIFLVSLGLCAGLVLLAACAPSTSLQAAAADLTGPFWALSTLMDKAVASNTGISIQFTSDGKVSGSSGCNRYSGTYTVSGNNMQISSPLATTRMACAQDVMDQENAYLKALGDVKSYAVSGDQLALKDGSNKALLVYKAQSQDLQGTSWNAVGYNNGKQAVTSVLAGTTLTAEFGKDGNLSGNGGCNTYSGPYKVNGDQITIGPLISTMKACGEPAGVMDQETQYLAALQSAATYQMEGNVLELRTKDGALAADFSKK